MNEQYDVLQTHLERLESGDTAATVTNNLPQEEAELVEFAAVLRQLAAPERDAEKVAMQRAALMQLAASHQARLPQTEKKRPFYHPLLNWLHQRSLVEQIGLAVIGILLLMFVSFPSLRSGQTQVAEDPAAADSVVNVIPADTEEDPVAVDSADVAADNEAEGAAVSSPALPHQLFIPNVSSPLIMDAKTAVLDNIQGVVEVQQADGSWTAVARIDTIQAGQRVRTSKLSSATLTFFDGSQAKLDAESELSIDDLNAKKREEGFRTVVMTLWRGDSDHAVQFRNDGGSVYAVNTPSGAGIARGTQFHVQVTADLLTRYIVTEGKVDVTGAGRTVSVTAGKLTTISSGNVPDEPAFNVSGEGEVEAIGTVWTIAGQTFQTDARTLIVGNPQIGDLVRIDGHLLDDGGRVAHRIVLLQRAISNRFTLSGEVTAMGSSWTVAAQTILVNGQTAVDENIAVGDTVRVDGMILLDGTLQASQIVFIDDGLGLPFAFSGVVQDMTDDRWTVSGQPIAIDDQTTLDGRIVVGDVVQVRGSIEAGDTWLAREITLRIDDLPTFEFTGLINSIDPWLVAGIPFETRSWTMIAPALEMGVLVRVTGSILSDGTRVAAAIVPLVEIGSDTIVFTGSVSSINPWIVDGLQLVVNSESRIMDRITVGSVVQVRVRLLANGTWSVLSMRLLYPDFGRGCLTLSSPVIMVNADTIRVKHWSVDIKRDGRIKIHGDIRVDSVITVPICTGWDGTIVIIGDIVVIYRPIVIIIDDGGSGNELPPGCRITKKGSIKCSNRGSKRS